MESINGIVIVDKPAGWTSHDVVAKLRGVYRQKRIGHSGTLDPMATGVLPIFIGRATRAIQFVENDDKVYLAGLRLGIVTDTQDISGKVLQTRDAIPDDEDVRKTIASFVGTIEQLPPMYSAIKIQGKKLYEYARKGIAVERKPRTIAIHSIDIIDKNGDDYILKVACSKGTYIRTLCNDIGERLGCGGVMSQLRRLQAGVFSAEQAVSLDFLISSYENAVNCVKPIDSLFLRYPSAVVPKEYETRCKNGTEYPCFEQEGIYRVYASDRSFLMLGSCSKGHMCTIKSFFEVGSE